MPGHHKSLPMKNYWETGIRCYIVGHKIYDELWMPMAPRKGDRLWLSSLTRGRVNVRDAIVSNVEWSMDQTSGNVNAWVHVRRAQPIGKKN